MPSGRWIQDPETGELLEPEEYYAIKASRHKGKGAYIMPDITPFVSPLDYSEISSRPALREHEKRHNVFQVGTDLKPSDYDVSKVRNVDSDKSRKAMESAFREAWQRHGPPKKERG